jgi:hypothetical protein
MTAVHLISGGFEMHRGDAVARVLRPKVVRGHGNKIRVRSNAKLTRRRDPNYRESVGELLEK